MSTLTVTIAGNNYQIKEGSFSLSDRIEEASRCSFVIDAAPSVSLFKGQQVTVTDSVRGLLFAGVVNEVGWKRLDPNNILRRSISCLDMTYYVQKRTSSEKYAGQYAGVIAVDQVQRRLAAEGITAEYALHRDTSQAEFETGTLTNTLAVAEPEGGALELAKAGSGFTWEIDPDDPVDDHIFTSTGIDINDEGEAILFPTASIKFIGSCTAANAGNCYAYVKIMDTNHVIQANETLSYEVLIRKSSPKIMSSMDIVCTDGTNLRSQSGSKDGQFLNPHASVDLSGHADDKWYIRSHNIGLTLAGKTIKFISIAFEGDEVGDYTAYFRGIRINDGGSISLMILSVFATALPQVPQLISTSGYANVKAEYCTTYDTSGVIQSDVVSLAGVGIYKDSVIAWDHDTPEGCDIKVTSGIDSGLNGSATSLYPLQTNGGQFNGLVPGQDTTDLATGFFIYLKNHSGNPEITPRLRKLTFKINPSYVSVKNDYLYKIRTSTDFNTGTVSNLSTANNILSMNGYRCRFDTALPASYTLYGNGTPGVQLSNKSCLLSVNNGTARDCKLRITSAGNRQNFVMTTLIKIPASTSLVPGLFYRTTNFGHGMDTAAYQVDLASNKVQLGRGSNSTSGSNGTYNSIQSVAMTLQAGDWHRLTVAVSGNNHLIYVDDVLKITASNNVFTAAGGCGLKLYNNTGLNAQNAHFRDFGIVDSLTGTWTSPALDISGVGADVLASFLRTQCYGDIAESDLKTEISLNNGSNYSVVPSIKTATQDDDNFTFMADDIPGLSSGADASALTQVRFRLTLSITSASAWIETHGSLFSVLSKFESSGTRITEALDLTGAGKVGSTVIAMNSNLPAGTLIQLAASPIEENWTNVVSGDPIPDIVAEGIPYIDSFDTDTSGNFTSAFTTGGSVAFWGYETTSSRIIADDGANASYLYNDIETEDFDIQATYTYSDFGGLVGRWIDANNHYIFAIRDDHAPAASNSVQAFKVVGGSQTTIGPSNIPINFPRFAPHIFRVVMIGSTITLYFDGEQIASFTDTSITGAGMVGMRNDSFMTGFRSILYNVRFKALGQDLNEPYVFSDPLDANTSSIYDSVSVDGTLATWTFDTTDNRLECTGGDNALLLHGDIRTQHVDISAVMSRTDVSGFCWRVSEDLQDGYVLIINDGSSYNSPDTTVLFKFEGGDNFTYVTEGFTSFTRGTDHTIRLTMVGDTITAYFDGAEIFEYVDSSPLQGGRIGLWTDGGDGYFTDLTITAPQSVYVRQLLTSTNPLHTPQLLDLTIAALHPHIGLGALITEDYNRQKETEVIADLADRSEYYSEIRANGSLVMRARDAEAAPWVATGDDMFINSIDAQTEANEYFNLIRLYNVTETVDFNQRFVGDGETTTWTLAYRLFSEPVITLNGQLRTVGLLDVDTGKDFYYEVGSDTITQDDAGVKLQREVDILSVSGTGQIETEVTRSNTGQFPGTMSQSDFQAISGGTGIVEKVVDAEGRSVTTAQAYGDAQLAKFGRIGKTINFKTYRHGLAPGQYLNVMQPHYAILDEDMLITDVAESLQSGPVTRTVYAIKATSGRNIGSWGKRFLNTMKG